MQAQEAASMPRREQEPGLTVVLLAKQPLSPRAAEMWLSVRNGSLLSSLHPADPPTRSRSTGPPVPLPLGPWAAPPVSSPQRS